MDKKGFDEAVIERDQPPQEYKVKNEVRLKIDTPKPKTPKTDTKPEIKKITSPTELGTITNRGQLRAFAQHTIACDFCPPTFDKITLPMALNVCFSMGLREPGQMLWALRSMYVLRKKVQIFGDLTLYVIRKNKDLDYLELYFLDDSGKKICVENGNAASPFVAGVLDIKRKSETKGNQFILTLHDLELTGVKYNPKTRQFIRQSKKTGVPEPAWLKNPKNMIFRKLIAIAATFIFGNLFEGAEVEEYSNANEIDDDNVKNKKNGRFQEVLTEKLDKETIKNNKEAMNNLKSSAVK